MDKNEKYILILEKLKEKDSSGEKLAFELNVTEKTLSNYISTINNYFEGSCKIFRVNNKYSLLIKNEDFFEKYNDLIVDYCSYKDNEYERKQTIISLLIEGSTTFEQLSNSLFLSTTTLNHIMNELRKELNEFRLKIVGKTNVGISLVGEEFNIRRLLIERYPYVYHFQTLPNELTKAIDKIKNRLNLDIDSYRKLSFSTSVVLNRLNNHHELDHKVEFENVILQSNDYKEVKEIKKFIEVHYPNVDNNKEVLPIVMQLMGRRASFVDEIINDEDEKLIGKIIKSTIKDVEDLYQITIAESLFTKDIQLHIKHLINRLLFEVSIDNVESIEIVKQFPFAYELSKILGDNVLKFIGIKPSIEELGYIAIYFSVYLEKLERTLIDYKKIAIVTDKGLSIQKLLLNHINHLLGEELTIDIITEFNNKQLTDCYDLVISTMILDIENENYIYLEKSYDLNLLKFKIEKFLMLREHNEKNMVTQNVLLNILLENDFIKLKEAVDYEDAFGRMISHLSLNEETQEELMHQLIIRESKKSTVFGKIAFPHTTYNGEQLIFKIGTLSNELKDYPDLNLIILLVVPKHYTNEKKLIKLYEEILSITSNKYLQNKIQENMDFEAFIYLLKQEMGD